MSLISSNAYILIFLSFSLVQISKSEDTSFCDENWTPGNDPNVKKCYKLMDTELRDFIHAQEICEEETGQNLVSIHSKVEQNFITKYIFQDNNVHDDVWIGLKKMEKNWVFTDGTPESDLKDFWSAGNPSNEVGAECVQMLYKIGKELGQLDDTSCSKRNLVLCQKNPALSKNHLRDFLKNITKIKSDCSTKQLKESGLESLGDFGDIYKDKFSYLGYFNEDGKQKAFMIPLRENKKASNFNDAAKVCNRFNSSLVEVPTWDKQMLLNSFLSRIWDDWIKKNEVYLWLNADVKIDRSIVWKASGTSKEKYTNWYKEPPTIFPDENGYNLAVFLTKNEHFGNWKNRPENSPSNIICEYSMN